MHVCTPMNQLLPLFSTAQSPLAVSQCRPSLIKCNPGVFVHMEVLKHLKMRHQWINIGCQHRCVGCYDIAWNCCGDEIFLSNIAFQSLDFAQTWSVQELYVPGSSFKAAIFSFMYFTILSADLTLCLSFDTFSFGSGVFSHLSFTWLWVLVRCDGGVWDVSATCGECIGSCHGR